MFAAASYLPQASSIAADVDWVFDLIFWVCTAFLAIIVGVAGVFVIRYRARSYRPDAEPAPTHNNRLELTWTAIPLALVFVIFGLSTAVYFRMVRAAPNAAEVQVTARKWSWWFDHPEGKGSPELHVVAGRPVELVMASNDVIHSLSIPAFRVKQDVVPGRYTRLRFTPTAAGRYPIYCTEYCGRDHSAMRTEVVVHADAADYQKWLERSAYEDSMPLAEVGKKVWEERGCKSCHSLDGTPIKGGGPSFKGLWGKTETLSSGKSVTVDENYIRESILDPRKEIVLGYGPIMPPTPLEEREIRGIIEFIKAQK
ncbi:MAG: cytochrome c oxidase subunit II [Deltaproteobacteria bacterium]|nr:MAG: cytochrome c oxidase subunit II [Deltaproteobacteria bacterium]